MDTRNQKLAENLVGYSCALKKGEKILIECKGLSGIPLLNCIVKEVYRVGALPFVEIYDETTERELLLGATEEQVTLLADIHRRRMLNMDAYIGLRCASNANELADVDSRHLEMHARIYGQSVHHEVRVEKTKWVVLRYPNAGMAQLSGTSTESFQRFYYDVCNLDYRKLSKAMEPLVAIMNDTDRVRITGNGTELSFSIKGIPAVKCDGRRNIPDGEVYTAPVKTSVNGTICYNAPSMYHGRTYRDVRLTFEDGRITEAVSSDTKRMNDIFDTDDGARYVGEFAIGVNPFVTEPMNDILFDEKIRGSFHFTPGSCYKEAYNGNVSAIHWDLVCIQTPEWGGGEIYFDDRLVRKDGLFVLPELEGLNPENLGIDKK